LAYVITQEGNNVSTEGSRKVKVHDVVITITTCRNTGDAVLIKVKAWKLASNFICLEDGSRKAKYKSVAREEDM
jgi:hypothetical protein